MKKLVIAILCAVSVASLCGCTKYYDVEGDVEKHVETSMVSVFVDEQTGVNCLIFTGGYAGGMTVRLDENGEVMVSE